MGIKYNEKFYRGLKTGISSYRQDQPMDGHYGKGIYYTISPGPAASWASDPGIVVEYKPKKPLHLKEYAEEVDWGTDLMKDLPNKYDGVYLSNSNQEAGQQIILRTYGKVTVNGYWEIKGPVYAGSLSEKNKKKFNPKP